jgi:hypothetical protein
MARKKTPKEPLSKIWMIRRKSDGLFSSCRSAHPRFGNRGGVQFSENRLIAHIRMVTKYHKKYFNSIPHPYAGCEIVQFSISEDAAIPYEVYGE